MANVKRETKDPPPPGMESTTDFEDWLDSGR